MLSRDAGSHLGRRVLVVEREVAQGLDKIMIQAHENR